MMPTNINQLMQFIMKSGNPQQTVYNMVRERAGGNPVMNNLLELAKEGKTNEIEVIARNIFKERGLDFDSEFNNFKRAMKF